MRAGYKMLARHKMPAEYTCNQWSSVKAALLRTRERTRGAVAGALASSLIVLTYPLAASAQNPTVTVNVDAGVNRHPINPSIYGVAHATTAQLNDLNSPLNRNGGNNTTRYNWQLNADNRGNDWY
jgi:hypothetical protein